MLNTEGKNRSLDAQRYDRYLVLRGRERSLEFLPHWQRTTAYIRMVHQLLKERGVPFALGLYPYAVQVSADQWKTERESYGFEVGRVYDDLYPVEWFEKFCAQEGIVLINTYPAFRQAVGQHLFYDWDGHFTPAGHDLVARQLMEDAGFADLLREASE